MGELIFGFLLVGIFVWFIIYIFISDKRFIDENKNFFSGIKHFLLWFFLTLILYLLIKDFNNIKEDNNVNNFNTSKIEYENFLNEPVEFLTKCSLNGKDYDLPENAHCKTLSKVNAWECNDGYVEVGEKCIRGFDNNKCNIKGNISFNSKTKVYYLPSCGRYNDVEINVNYGERWFCSEQEAINSGWIKANSCY